MKNNKNPFQVLGLDPHLISSLNDEQIEIMIEASYKALQNIFHPDKAGGNVKKSQAINQARQLLDRQTNPEGYQAFKQHFLKKTAKSLKIAQSDNQINHLLKTNQILRLAFTDYLINAKALNQQLTVFNIGACTMKMRDYGAGLNIKILTKELGPKNIRQAIKEHLYFDLVVTNNGSLEKIRRGKTEKCPNKKLIAAIDEQTIVKNESMVNILRQAYPIWTPDNEELRQELKTPSNKKIPEKEIIHFRNIIQPDEFAKIIPLVSPLITKDCYLFCLNTIQKNFFFSLEGKLMKIIL